MVGFEIASLLVFFVFFYLYSDVEKVGVGGWVVVGAFGL